MSIIINNKYKIEESLGEGSFGKIFKGITIKNNNQVAIKIQFKNVTNILKQEAQIYKYLQGNIGIPTIYNYGNQDGFNYLVLDLLGPSLYEIDIEKHDVIKYFLDALNIIEILHNKYLIHRDIKPENFLLNLERKSLFLIDYGLTKIYIKNNEHIKECKDKKLIGTPNYCSINVHNGNESSRRDDIESLCYTFIYLYKKHLPWSKIYEDNDSKKDKIKKISKEIIYNNIKILKEKSFDWLLEYPGEFITVLFYSKMLKFDEKPNYIYIKNVLNNLLNLLN